MKCWGLESQGKCKTWASCFISVRGSLSKLDSDFSAVLCYEACGPCSTCWGQRSLPSLFSWLADWFIPLLFSKPSSLHALVKILVSSTSVDSVCVCLCACACVCTAHRPLDAVISWGNVQAVNFFITSCSCNLKILTLEGNNGMNKIKIKKVNYPLCL